MVQDSSPVAALTKAEGTAWSGFLRAHSLITRQLDVDLRAAVDLALSEFEILLHLAWAGGESRMARIAHEVVLTGGGVTRIVARLEKLGLIERRSCPNDGRGVFAVLTEKGWRLQRSAQQVHLEGVRRLFLREASARDLATLSRVFGRVAENAGAHPEAAGGACALGDPASSGSKPNLRKRAARATDRTS